MYFSNTLCPSQIDGKLYVYVYASIRLELSKKLHLRLEYVCFHYLTKRKRTSSQQPIFPRLIFLF